MEGHHFRIYEGQYWCENEDVVSEECTDWDRCNNECVCNSVENDPEFGNTGLWAYEEDDDDA